SFVLARVLTYRFPPPSHRNDDFPFIQSQGRQGNLGIESSIRGKVRNQKETHTFLLTFGELRPD
ncbi:hypothetical protein, partial [Lactococcus lactis]|uniref:hypothetical protein n=1 Tax=Lactococcus lactis TaxID=1358 RepID=UPI001C5FBB47